VLNQNQIVAGRISISNGADKNVSPVFVIILTLYPSPFSLIYKTVLFVKSPKETFNNY